MTTLLHYFQLLTGEQQNKISQPVPILGMLQASKTLAQPIDMKKSIDAKFVYDNNINNNIEHGDDFVDKDHVENDVDRRVPDKNPIINKRILLGNDSLLVNLYDADDEANNDDANEQLKIKHIRSTDEFSNLLNNNNTDQIVVVQVPEAVIDRDNVIIDKLKYNLNNNDNKQQQQQYQPQPQQQPLLVRPPSEGRIVVYGDSNCLDSTHMEKPCFWLLDALLEYTMTSHVSTLLKDLNRSSTVTFDNSLNLPLRLPNNNLHLYSKVLENNNNNGATNGHINKRDIPQCMALRWENPVFLNLTAPSNLYPNNRDSENELDGNVGALRRRLESQKGEVRSTTF